MTGKMLLLFILLKKHTNKLHLFMYINSFQLKNRNETIKNLWVVIILFSFSKLSWCGSSLLLLFCRSFHLGFLLGEQKQISPSQISLLSQL